MVQVSVITTMFNAQATIERAMRSVIVQDPDWELIVVDDASTDDSAIIAERIAAERPDRITVLRQTTNQGPSAGRNAALERATGHWLAFLDADDEFTPQRLTLMLAAAQEQDDIVVCRHEVVQVDGKHRVRGTDVARDYDAEAALPAILADRVTPYLWDKIFRREPITGIRFFEAVRRAEDLLFCAAAAEVARGMRCIPDVGYIYYISPSSLTWGRVASIAETTDLLNELDRICAPAAHRADVRRGLATRHLLSYLNIINQTIPQPATLARNSFVRAAARQISWRQIRDSAALQPTFAAAAVVVKALPRLYMRIFRSYIKRAYSLTG